MTPRIRLLVLRCADIEASLRFFQALGFVFSREKHGAGAEHYASDSSDFVMELYPLAPGAAADKNRLGFEVADFGSVLEALRLPDGAEVDAIRHMVLQDPDGRKVELLKKTVA